MMCHLQTQTIFIFQFVNDGVWAPPSLAPLTTILDPMDLRIQMAPSD